MKKILTVFTAFFLGILLMILMLLLPLSGLPERESEGTTGGTDIVDVARTQVGNVGGQPYWSWYGFSTRVEWCACFVSWCADQCGYIESGVIPKYAACVSGVQWFKDNGQWRDVAGYTPKAGDIIFFDWNLDGRSDHTGIVAGYEEGVIQTIEGNTSSVSQAHGDACEEKERTTAFVLGYGVPDYPEIELVEGTYDEQVYNYLRAKGFSKAAACGILGNMYQESGVNPTSIQGNGRGPAAGICQWENYNTKSGRWKRLYDRAEEQGVEWTDLKLQLDFMIWELSGGDAACKHLMEVNYGGLNAFKSTTDVEWATEVFERCFERAGKPMMTNRITKANQYFERFD